MSIYNAPILGLGKKRAPLCFLHVPKCAGTSIYEALEASLPPGALASRRSDTSVFSGGFSAFDELPEPARSLIAVDDAEISALGDHAVVGGHFALSTLLRLAPASNIATVLREPRARLLSAFMFLRLTPLVDFWGPYGREVLAGPTQSLELMLSDPLVAETTDNQICRLLLDGDPRVRQGEFVAPDDVAGLADDALDRLGELGYLGILELDDVWADLSRFFDAALEPVRANVSGASTIPDGALPMPPFDMRRVLELLERRNRADRLVYETLVASRRGGDRDEARWIADAALADQWVRFGDVAGTTATRLLEAR